MSGEHFIPFRKNDVVSMCADELPAGEQESFRGFARMLASLLHHQFHARIEALRNVGLQVMDIVDRKATQELWDASENLDAACENCHRSYWYPGETPEWYRGLDRRMRERNYPTGTRVPEPVEK